MPRALITGGSAGLGRALAAALAAHKWDVIITGRDERMLSATAHDLGHQVTAVAGDVIDATHRAALAERVSEGLDLLVNNASTLGGSPLLPVLDQSVDAVRSVFETNVLAPIALIQTLRPFMRMGGAVINISSDAAVEHYETWGGYASSKAALDHVTLTLAAEDPDIRWWAIDPGDMRTQMHQDAFPGEDISDRPEPEAVVPSLLALIDRRPPSGRYRASEFAPVGV